MSLHPQEKFTLVDKNPSTNLAKIKAQVEKGLKEFKHNKIKRNLMTMESGLQVNSQNRWQVLLSRLFLSENLILQRSLI